MPRENLLRIQPTNTFRNFYSSPKIYKFAEKQKEIQPQGFYRKNARRLNAHDRIGMRMNLPVCCSGGGVRSPVNGGAVRPVSAPVTACGGGGVWSFLGAQYGLREQSERESKEWHSGGDPPWPIYRYGWPANGAD